MKGIIFDIKEFALNDGDGIRTTVFFKGCPLRCIWCHNPEGLSPAPELYIKHNGCKNCGLCKLACTHEECKPYGRCIHICPADLISIAGKEYTAEELADKLLNGAEIYKSTGGGVTLSGGEPLLQADFAYELLKLLGGKVHRTIETSGFADEKTFAGIISECDFVYMDIKLADEDMHIKYTGRSNKNILRNIEILKASSVPHKFRIPLIPKITDTHENLSAISKLIGNDSVELLPYNTLAPAKYRSVGRVFSSVIEQEAISKIDLSLFKNAKIRK